MSQKIIEQNISNLVEFEFPQFFRTDGPVFVQFVKEYYKWMEGSSFKSKKINKILVDIAAKSNIVTSKLSIDFNQFFKNNEKIAIYDEENDYRIYEIQEIVSAKKLILTTNTHFSGNNLCIGKVEYLPNALYLSRKLFEYDDVDTTVEDFVIYFKEKYLKNIQFETQTNTRQLIKHSLDIYRSKGSERSVDLLFRLVFGQPASFYYPKDDLFKLSDGKWHVPKYLELELNENTDKFVNKQIVGLNSGATAFAEALIRRTVKGKVIDVLYISAINGNFETNEIINTNDSSVENNKCPRIIGSLTKINVDVDGTGDLYKLGDIVDVYSESGEQGKARVTSIADITGTVDYSLNDTGYAYTTNAEVHISEKAMIIKDVVANNTQTYFDLFETLVQPLANVSYYNSNVTFDVGSTINTYHANNLLKGVGTIISVTETNSTSGSLLLDVVSGNLNSGIIYTSSNTGEANVSLFLDKTAVGNVIAYSSKMKMKVSNVSGTFINNEIIEQRNSANISFCSATMNNFSTTVGANGIIKAINVEHVFLTSNTIYGKTSGASAYLNNVEFSVGVKDITNDFVSYSGNKIYGNTFFTTANVSIIGQGHNASFNLANSLIYSEIVQLNTDFVRTYANTALNAVAYNFPHDPAANISSDLIDALNFDIVDIGRPNKIININKGSEYNIAPFVLVFEPLTFHMTRNDKVKLTVDKPYFYIGEMITQPSSNARGLIQSINGNDIVISNLRLFSENDFVATTNSTTTIYGEKSALVANISEIQNFEKLPKYNIMGGDFIVTTNTSFSEGAVTGLAVVDSGVGFVDGEEITFKKQGLAEGYGFASVTTNGKSSGRYKQKGGFLSDQKKLQDGYYYQNYSYEIRSSIPLLKYEEMLKKLLHVSGTKYFGAYVKQSEKSVKIKSKQSVITVT